eukprot:SAG31_NODE_474_length_15176_cov_7.362340_7_plen_210_part_00
MRFCLLASLFIAAAVARAAEPQAVEMCEPADSRDAMLGLAAAICDRSSVSTALSRLGVPGAIADVVGHQMAEVDLHTVRDLRLLADADAEELLRVELTSNKVSLGIRSKVRLLMDADPAAKHEATVDARAAPSDQTVLVADHMHSSSRRKMQAADDGISLDTIAIVLSVLVGATGCELPPGPPQCLATYAYTCRTFGTIRQTLLACALW